MSCAIDGCSKPIKGRGWCSMHYSRWQRRGTPLPHIPTASELFWAKVDAGGGPDACWLWTGALTDGYGRFCTGSWRHGSRAQWAAHRFAYEETVGRPIPDGLQLDHLCRVRNCVNPAHLEPVTPRENFVRSEAIGARATRLGVCKRGHEFTPENTETHPGKFGRGCLECRRLRSEKYAERRRARGGVAS